MFIERPPLFYRMLFPETIWRLPCKEKTLSSDIACSSCLLWGYAAQLAEMVITDIFYTIS